ncbi:MAG TPA: hypothetical protein DEP20_01150 [Fusobacteria bacterium]|nr:hypothetical protein [Fusobacteriota bacterium]|tara:strand:+ start:628 stop:1182 length:555 start_codon:yes stop_codon:yes gene_type:complete
MNKKFLSFIIFSAFSISSFADWRGLSLRSISGVHAKWRKMVNEELGINDSEKGMGVLAGFGLEYAFDFIPENYYLSVELGFPYYDQMFSGGQIMSQPVFGRFLFPKTFLLVIPVIYVYVGYKFKDETLITLGATYLWGVNASIRKMISDNVSFEIHGTLFLDRLFIDDGLHDAHLMFSLRYLFN